MDKTSTRSQWKKYYDTGFWQNRRKIQLKAHPRCAFCAAKGLVVPARVVDHVEPHNGDWTKFRTSELQSLCFDCHDKTKRNIDLRGYSDDINDDGWPTDPKHPANRASRRRFRYSIPHVAVRNPGDADLRAARVGQDHAGQAMRDARGRDHRS
jgi:hypothetical protein